ncbi:unannotated protein [freshwater metagenome]|uniref:Unannotated protein n=1 Tax=freshwater metagenome TaxID=449393 RepID=A0A6J6NMT7_9ZZZZ
MRFPIVLFDFDGTVVDSGPIILASMKYATVTILGREIPDAELMASVGGPGLEAQMEMFGPGRVEELVTAYRAHNEPLHAELEAFAGMSEVLGALVKQGRRLGVVSAKRRATVMLGFDAVPVGGFFEVIVGGDEVPRQKPAPDGLLLALERLGGRPEDAAYVGDSPFDMQAARSAGLYAVGVEWGGIHTGAALGAADVLITEPSALLEVLA